MNYETIICLIKIITTIIWLNICYHPKRLLIYLIINQYIYFLGGICHFIGHIQILTQKIKLNTISNVFMHAMAATVCRCLPILRFSRPLLQLIDRTTHQFSTSWLPPCTYLNGIIYQQHEWLKVDLNRCIFSNAHTVPAGSCTEQCSDVNHRNREQTLLIRFQEVPGVVCGRDGVIAQDVIWILVHLPSSCCKSCHY